MRMIKEQSISTRAAGISARDQTPVLPAIPRPLSTSCFLRARQGKGRRQISAGRAKARPPPHTGRRPGRRAPRGVHLDAPGEQPSEGETEKGEPEIPHHVAGWR